ncbi:FAD-dependent oxidoreductase [Gammaproteobacteria bacterium SCGC AG-212-F23]|nr:FAD-dependent oxidoreductase [Gammaproteobacteria bacterium SCGC AG-212-F23]
MQTHVAIIGAGPAGLTAAYLLSKHNIHVTVLESDPEYVGGIARTVQYKGYCFDIGGHRFFSKSKEVEDFWSEILPNDMLNRPRSSRIFYRGKFFAYPLKIFEVLFKLGIWQSVYCFLSYLRAKLFPVKDPKNFEEWVSNHFGKKLFSIFFKTYTEKVWGMDCRQISADWAAQRIKGLSLMSAIMNALKPARKSSDVIKTLINTFRYPRKGPGMLWEACAEKIKHSGNIVLLGQRVTGCEFDGKCWHITYKNSDGDIGLFDATHVISSAPLHEMIIDYFKPQLPTAVLHAASQLKYRDFLIVVLILKDKKHFDDNWIYIHDPTVDVGRIQNFKSWSPEMVPDPSMCCYGMEYFCFAGDGLWESHDNDLIEKAKHEIQKIGLANAEDIIDGCVVRQPKAYPVYDADYKKNVAIIREEIEKNYPSFYFVGRNGMHKYNNQDHAMMTAMLSVKNILAGKKQYDIWQVNQDAEYHESGEAGQLGMGLRSVPEKVI